MENNQGIKEQIIKALVDLTNALCQKRSERRADKKLDDDEVFGLAAAAFSEHQGRGPLFEDILDRLRKDDVYLEEQRSRMAFLAAEKEVHTEIRCRLYGDGVEYAGLNEDSDIKALSQRLDGIVKLFEGMPEAEQSKLLFKSKVPVWAINTVVLNNLLRNMKHIVEVQKKQKDNMAKLIHDYGKIIDAIKDIQKALKAQNKEETIKVIRDFFNMPE